MELANLQDNIVLVIALAALGGLVVGWLLTYLLIGRGPSKTELTSKLADVEEEFESHKQSVDKHFATTSELVNDLTESYVKVYKHLSEGAEQLGGVVDMRHRLTLDDSPAPPHPDVEDNNEVIEGALATAAVGAAGVAAATANADDPEFTVSDEGVEETLNELEANATSARDAVPEADPDALPDAAGVADAEATSQTSPAAEDAIKNKATS